MDIGKISYYCRRIHRISLWGITGLGLIQVVTGLTLKYPNTLFFIDPVAARQFHLVTSTYFAIFFLISMVTGLFMYFTPWLLRMTRKNPPKTV